MTPITVLLILIIVALAIYCVQLLNKNDGLHWLIKSLDDRIFDAEKQIERHQLIVNYPKGQFVLVSTMDDSSSPFVRTFETREKARQAGINHLRTHHTQMCQEYIDDDDLWTNRNESFGADVWLFVCELNRQMQPEPEEPINSINED
ncbi:MAG: hypothetical protein WCH39_22630 [Schlesneria sp.]